MVKMTKSLNIAAVHLRHPLTGCPAVADPVRYYQQNGRNVGLVLQFPDGHTASLSYSEIGELQRSETAAVEDE